MMADSAVTLGQPHQTLRACRLCHEAGYDIVPGAVMSGKASARVITIGQAPGVTEVEAKRPFNASSGRRLFAWLAEAGWDEATFRQTQYMTSVTKCYPGKHTNGKGDRVPTKAEQRLCAPFLEQELRLVQPRLIIPIGNLAIKLFFRGRTTLRELIGSALFLPAGSWHSAEPFDMRAAIRVRTRAKHDAGGRYIVPLPHPSGASLWPNKPQNKRLIGEAIALLAALRSDWLD